jgi:anthranilate phosphoribosyltransferase
MEHATKQFDEGSARALGRVLRGEALGEAEAEAAMGGLLDGRWTAAQAGAFLGGLAARGEQEGELAGFARALRARCERVEGGAEAVDTCGTGGSGLATANTSTAVALVLAATGVPVAKHGNRASSGRCGSADVLEEAGVVVDLGPEEAARLLGKLGLVFLFAPRFHPALRALAPVRRELGARTVFNLIGPLCNPAGVRRQVVGVSDPERGRRVAGALARLGVERALVVAGEEGLDELSLCGPSRLWEVSEGDPKERRFEPEALGLARVPFEAIAGGDRSANRAALEAVLSGEERGAPSTHVALNAAAGFWASGRADSLAEGLEMAREVLASGAALALLERYRQESRALREAA